MPEQETPVWTPAVGNLVVLHHTGCSGEVVFKNIAADCELFSLKLKDSLYLEPVDGKTEAVAKAGELVKVYYHPSHEKPERIVFIINDKVQKDFTVDEKEPEKFTLARHPNDGAPKTSRFNFNHWVCWDGGKHESYDPEWRGGHNYDVNKAMPCANVKINNPGKLLRERSRVEEQIGNLTDANWQRYLAWVDENEESNAFFGDYDLAVEDAREGLDNLMEGTGLEWGFGGRSGGYFCLKDVCDEETWNLEPLSEEEEAALDGYYELEKELPEEQLAQMRLLDERRDNALNAGDKAVVKAALHTVEMTADDEVAYQFMCNVARRFEDMLEEEQARLQQASIEKNREKAVDLLEWFAVFAEEHTEWMEEKFLEDKGSAENEWYEEVKQWIQEKRHLDKKE